MIILSCDKVETATQPPAASRGMGPVRKRHLHELNWSIDDLTLGIPMGIYYDCTTLKRELSITDCDDDSILNSS